MSKLKILLLGGIISILSIGYSSAVSISCTEDQGYVCNPSQIILDNITLNASQFSSNDTFQTDLNCEYDDLFLLCGGGGCNIMDEESIEISEAPQICNIGYDGNNGDITLNYTPSNSGGGDNNTGGDDNTGGDIGGDTGGESGGGSSGGYNLFTDLSNVVTGIVTVMSEFIPYVVYISIGILICTLGFVAIRRLVNRLNGKIKSNFSSKRR